MLGEHDSIAISPSTEFAKEHRKWEATHTRYGPPGRPYRFQEFPKRMYRAEYVKGKGFDIVEAREVGNELEEGNLHSRGFFFGPDKAIAAAERAQTESGALAAEREWEIQHGRLSESAVREVRAHEAEAGAVHLPTIPETKRRGRPKKVAETV